ncbi:MAG: hypothetical protein HYZ53_05030 [Planctomycetes bacterium]|nr:hypothetical protein [Planctomycetota bacterium]
MPRNIDFAVDKLFVEGGDDQAVVNALVETRLGKDIATRKLVHAPKGRGGADWAMGEFERFLEEARRGACVGLIVDRDGVEARPDNWPRVAALLGRLGVSEARTAPNGVSIDLPTRQVRAGVWLWPDNQSVGDVEDFVTPLMPDTPVWHFAAESTRIAKESHGAEYAVSDSRKARLKVRSVWCDATGGGYGHLLRRLSLAPSPAADAFILWFETLFLA